MLLLLTGYIHITLILIGIASLGSLWPGSCFGIGSINKYNRSRLPTKAEGQHGKSQFLHICLIRIVCNVYTCIDLHVNLISSNLDPKEKNDGNFYFVGDIRIVSTFLVFRQHGYEVIFHILLDYHFYTSQSKQLAAATFK